MANIDNLDKINAYLESKFIEYIYDKNKHEIFQLMNVIDITLFLNSLSENRLKELCVIFNIKDRTKKNKEELLEHVLLFLENIKNNYYFIVEHDDFLDYGDRIEEAFVQYQVSISCYNPCKDRHIFSISTYIKGYCCHTDGFLFEEITTPIFSFDSSLTDEEKDFIKIFFKKDGLKTIRCKLYDTDFKQFSSRIYCACLKELLNQSHIDSSDDYSDNSSEEYSDDSNNPYESD